MRKEDPRFTKENMGRDITRRTIAEKFRLPGGSHRIKREYSEIKKDCGIDVDLRVVRFQKDKINVWNRYTALFEVWKHGGERNGDFLCGSEIVGSLFYNPCYFFHQHVENALLFTMYDDDKTAKKLELRNYVKFLKMKGYKYSLRENENARK